MLIEFFSMYECFIWINWICLNSVAYIIVSSSNEQSSTAPVYNPPKAGVLQIGIRAMTIR